MDLAELIASLDDDTSIVAASALESSWQDKHSCRDEDCWGFSAYPVDLFRRILDAAVGAIAACRHCQQPVKRCDDDYVGHECNGWCHTDRFHRCDPRHISGERNVHAEPGKPVFADAGAGIGTKCLLAQRAGCRAYGIEHNKHYVEEAVKLGADVGLADVRNWDFSEADIVWVNCPLREPADEIAFEAHVAGQLRPGAVLCLANSPGQPPAGWELLTSVINRDGAWRKPAFATGGVIQGARGDDSVPAFLSRDCLPVHHQDAGGP